jgi:predicted Fe-S protein YdhL (DUF1289 family)
MSTIAFAAATFKLSARLEPNRAKSNRANSDRAMTAIETPCIDICIVDQHSALCVGCGRSLAEIAAWSRYSADERSRVMANLPQRLDRLRRTRSAPADVT